STAATRGQKVFASLTTGEVQVAAAGATVAGFIETAFYAASDCDAGELVKISTWSK
ncbi:TPA: phage cement protein, partial [Klebsiella michiganensis]